MMKKFAKILFPVLTGILLILVFAACGEPQGGKKDSFAGTWTATDQQLGEYSWTFDGKGGCTFKNQYYEAAGEYTLDEQESTVTITTVWDEEKVLNYTVTDTTLEMKSEYQSFQLTKQTDK